MKKSILIEEIKKKINFKIDQLKNRKSKFIKSYLQAFNKIATVPNFVEAIISFLSLSRSTTLYNIEFHNDEDRLIWLNNIIRLSVEISKLQNEFDIKPLGILIKHSDLILNLFDSCNNKNALPNEVNALFKLMEENQTELSHVKLEHEKETADLDLFWFSYTGYHWNSSLQHVIGCTHDKRAVNVILPWRDLIIQLLNKFYSVRYKGRVIKLFESEIKFIKDYVVAEVQSS